MSHMARAVLGRLFWRSFCCALSNFPSFFFFSEKRKKQKSPGFFFPPQKKKKKKNKQQPKRSPAELRFASAIAEASPHSPPLPWKLWSSCAKAGAGAWSSSSQELGARGVSIGRWRGEGVRWGEGEGPGGLQIPQSHRGSNFK